MLVGMMASGKTTIGQALAARLGRRFADSDAMIEARTGRTVAEIFEHEGEPAFRALETEVLREALHAPEPTVVAAAGGVVQSEVNRRLLRGAGVPVVWLRADPSTLAARVEAAGQTHRPLLADDPAGVLARLADARAAWYGEVATTVVDVDGRPVADIVDDVLAGVGAR